MWHRSTRLIMGIDLKTLKAVFLLLLFIHPSANSQWFWSDHYYEIKYRHSVIIYAKGKPTIEGPFTVFTKWPENLEWRVKTEDVRSIKDIGPLSPEEIKKQNGSY